MEAVCGLADNSEISFIGISFKVAYAYTYDVFVYVLRDQVGPCPFTVYFVCTVVLMDH